MFIAAYRSACSGERNRAVHGMCRVPPSTETFEMNVLKNMLPSAAVCRLSDVSGRAAAFPLTSHVAALSVPGL